MANGVYKKIYAQEESLLSQGETLLVTKVSRPKVDMRRMNARVPIPVTLWRAVLCIKEQVGSVSASRTQILQDANTPQVQIIYRSSTLDQKQ
jgi:hypothetical protein